MPKKEDVLSRQKNSVGFLDFPRDVTIENRQAAYDAYHELVRGKIKVLGLNFKATQFMNSGGLGLLISLVEDARQAGQEVYAFGLDPYHRKLFRVVGLTERITLIAEENEIELN